MALPSAQDAEVESSHKEIQSTPAQALRLPFIAPRGKQSPKAKLSLTHCHLAMESVHGNPNNSGSLQQLLLPVLAIVSVQAWRYSQQSSFPVLLQLGDITANNPSQIAVTINAEKTLAQFEKAFVNFSSVHKPISSSDLLIHFQKTKTTHEATQFRYQLIKFIEQLTDAPMLTLLLLATSDGIEVNWLFDAERCEQRAIAQWKAQLEVAALNYLENTHRPLSQLSFTLTEQIQSESQEQNTNNPILADSATEITLPHQMIEQIASRYPKYKAAQYDSSAIEYQDLNRQANQLAHYLLSLGVAREQRVAVLVDPGFQILITLLAIFKCNATYVPLDPGFPEQRIKTIIDDVEPTVILCQSQYQQLFSERTVVCLDKIANQLAQLSDQNLELTTAPDQVAYIFYTSGTTGKPKGVMATHRNLNYYLSSAQFKYQLNPSDVMTSCARSTFSISMFELLLPLINGATVRILSREQLLDLAYMTKALEQVTIMHMGPSLLKLLLLHIKSTISDLSIFRRLRHLSSGGDLVPPELLTLARELFPRIEMYVIYGCSEISCMGCTWPVPEQVPIENTFVGRPFPDTKLLLIDADGNPVPNGSKGEICFAGKGVVKGYLNNPELTQEKFFPHLGNVYYKTGDVGILNFDGNLEILGREDFQIQFKGIRIEPTEIEYHIKQFENIKDCVVTLHRANPSSSQLIAYYVTFNSDEINLAKLKQFIELRLPDYMVPSQYIRLDALPLNFNLKVDRKALIKRPPEQLSTLVENNFKTETESILGAIWEDILTLNTVSRYDNFFDIGGDSLSAVIMIMEVQKKLGKAIYGLDVARESLAIIAAKLDDKPSGEIIDLAKKPKQYSLNTLFFGEHNELFAAFYSPQETRKKSAILICPPMGQEHVRCDFVLRKLAKKLAEKGHPTLLFDPFATGNSQGMDQQIDVKRWQKDQQLAYHKLREITGLDNVSVIAIRLAATLATTSFSSLNVNRLLLWDPIFDGCKHIDNMKKCHKALVKKMRYIKLFNFRPSSYSKNQLLGVELSNALRHDLERMIFKHHKLEKFSSVVTVCSDEHSKQLSNPLLSNCNWLNIEEYCGWYDPELFEKPLTNHRVANAIMEQLEDLP